MNFNPSAGFVKSQNRAGLKSAPDIGFMSKSFVVTGQRLDMDALGVGRQPWLASTMASYYNTKHSEHHALHGAHALWLNLLATLVTMWNSG